MRRFLKILSNLFIGLSACLLGICLAILDYCNMGDVAILVFVMFGLLFFGLSFMNWD